MLPMPPILDDYRRLANEIRKTNDADTKTRTRRIRRAMARGDFVSVGPLLKPTLDRRPRNPELWGILNHVVQTGSLNRKHAEEMVDNLLQNDSKNSFCYEWKAMRLLDDAESPESPTLAEAKKKLDFAIEYSDEPWPLYWTFARIQSCQGNLDGALITLREVQTKCPENVR